MLKKVPLFDVKIVYDREFTIAWNILNEIRKSIDLQLQQHNYSTKDRDSVIIIINELLENVLKYLDQHTAHIIIESFTKNSNNLFIKLESPINPDNKYRIDALKKDIIIVNSYNNLDKLYLDSLMNSFSQDAEINRIGFSLIRKLAGGGKIKIEKSARYRPGVIFKILYYL